MDQQRRQYFQIKGAKVFASANDISRISEPLASRFIKFFLSKYTEEQVLDISEFMFSQHVETYSFVEQSSNEIFYKSNGLTNKRREILDKIREGNYDELPKLSQVVVVPNKRYD